MSPIKDRETEKQEVKKPPASEVKTVKQKSPTKQLDFSDKKGIYLIPCVLDPVYTDWSLTEIQCYVVEALF